MATIVISTTVDVLIPERIAHHECFVVGSVFGLACTANCIEFGKPIQYLRGASVDLLFPSKNLIYRFVKRIDRLDILRVFELALKVLSFCIQLSQLLSRRIQLKQQLSTTHLQQHLGLPIPLIHFKRPLHALHQLSVVTAPILLSRLMHSSMQFRGQPKRGFDKVLLVDAGSHASIIVPSEKSAIASIMEICLYHYSMPPLRKHK